MLAAYSSTRLAALVWFAIVALSACNISFTAEINDAKLTTQPLVEQLPLRVGVYYDDELRNYHKQIIDDDFFLGPPTIELFDQVLNFMFQEVVLLEESPPSSQIASSIDALIEPKVRYFRHALHATTLTYDVKFYTPQRSVISTFFPSGRAEYGDFVVGCDLCLAGDRYLGYWAAITAMQRAAALFMVQFYESQEIKDWLRLKQQDAP